MVLYKNHNKREGRIEKSSMRNHEGCRMMTNADPSNSLTQDYWISFFLLTIQLWSFVFKNFQQLLNTLRSDIPR